MTTFHKEKAKTALALPIGKLFNARYRQVAVALPIVSVILRRILRSGKAAEVVYSVINVCSTDDK